MSTSTQRASEELIVAMYCLIHAANKKRPATSNKITLPPAAKLTKRAVTLSISKLAAYILHKEMVSVQHTIQKHPKLQ
jgi:hypothetical protein